MASNCTVSPVQIVVVVRFVKVTAGGVPIVTTTKPVGAVAIISLVRAEPEIGKDCGEDAVP